MKISGALKTLIKKIESGAVVTTQSNPQNYAKALAKIAQRQQK